MKIQLKNASVMRLQINFVNGPTEDLYNLRYTEGYSEKEKRFFCVDFFIRLQLSAQETLLEMEYRAEFETDADITEDFKKSPFPKVNAPSIAFPFLRSTVNSIVVNAGQGMLILPTINFQKIFNDRESLGQQEQGSSQE